MKTQKPAYACAIAAIVMLGAFYATQNLSFCVYALLCILAGWNCINAYEDHQKATERAKKNALLKKRQEAERMEKEAHAKRIAKEFADKYREVI